MCSTAVVFVCVDALEDALQVGVGEGPLERLGDLSVVAAEREQSLGEFFPLDD